MSSPADFNAQVIEEYRANGGKVTGMFANMDLLLLTTIGAKSGQPRIAPLAYGKEGDRIFIIASKGGAPTNPDWYHNILANPKVNVELGTNRFEANAVPVEGEERTRIYNMIAAQYPNFAEYQKNTTREIPVILLERLS